MVQNINERCVLVTRDRISQEAVELLAAHHFKVVYSPPYTPEAEIVETAKAHKVDAIMVSQSKITKKVIAASGAVQVIVKHGSGVNNINLQAAEALGIPVYRAVGANAQAVAEHALAMLFVLRKSLFYLDKSTKNSEWLKGSFKGADIEGATLGLIGLGEIGRKVATMATCLGMKVIAFDPAVNQAAIDAMPQIEFVDSPQVIAGKADVISLHCPLTPQTRHLINDAFLRLMPAHAAIVNTARGGIIDEDALAVALTEGRIAGAALDSFENEPPNMDAPLWKSPNLITTPHTAGLTPGAEQAMATIAAQIIIDHFDNKPIAPAFKAEASVLGGLTE